MAALEITGKAEKRFMEASGLLYMLDPVRGAPTVHGLDKHLHDGGVTRSHLLKSKFLDSFALICSTKKNGDSVSAAALEEGLPDGTVIRVASNAGVASSTLLRLQEIVQVLNGVATGASATGKENELLLMIVDLCIDKIREYLKQIRKTHKVNLDIPKMGSKFDDADLRPFLEWLKALNVIVSSRQELPNRGTLAVYIQWASKARWRYGDYLEAAFCEQGQGLPKWLQCIYKLGRYAVASKALLQLALAMPALFCPMRVETVGAPSKRPYRVTDDSPLTSILRRVVGGQEDDVISRLAGVWNDTDPNARFGRVSSVDRAVHAEMQLISYYDDHVDVMPQFRYIGLSKKSCYLCHQFLQRHPHLFSVSSCHQKLYLSWRAPPVADPKVYQRYKGIVSDLSESMEQVARQELGSRLGIRRRIPQDSTAGVSLTGLTSYGSGRRVETIVPRHERSAQAPEVLSSISELRPSSATEDGMSLVSAEGTEKEPNAILSMAFHVVRADNTLRQDIVAATDILDPRSGEPSWSKLVQLLRVDDPFGVQFQEKEEFFLVNNRVRVGNDRQFRACLQFLCNATRLNSDLTVQRYEMLRVGENLARESTTTGTPTPPSSDSTFG